MLTKRDFELIATIIRTSPNAAGEDLISRRELAEAFANALENENPRFDSDKFLIECWL